MSFPFKHAFFSSFYAVGQIGLGLLLHPYQTLQSVVQEKVFVGMVMIPSMILAILVPTWRFLFLPILEKIFECQPNYPYACEAIAFLALWVTFFCVYWQILLLYLYIRFTQAFK